MYDRPWNQKASPLVSQTGDPRSQRSRRSRSGNRVLTQLQTKKPQSISPPRIKVAHAKPVQKGTPIRQVSKPKQPPPAVPASSSANVSYNQSSQSTGLNYSQAPITPTCGLRATAIRHGKSTPGATETGSPLSPVWRSQDQTHDFSMDAVYDEPWERHVRSQPCSNSKERDYSTLPLKHSQRDSLKKSRECPVRSTDSAEIQRSKRHVTSLSFVCLSQETSPPGLQPIDLPNSSSRVSDSHAARIASSVETAFICSSPITPILESQQRASEERERQIQAISNQVYDVPPDADQFSSSSKLSSTDHLCCRIASDTAAGSITTRADLSVPISVNPLSTPDAVVREEDPDPPDDPTPTEESVRTVPEPFSLHHFPRRTFAAQIALRSPVRHIDSTTSGDTSTQATPLQSDFDFTFGSKHGAHKTSFTEYDVPWEFCSHAKLSRVMKNKEKSLISSQDDTSLHSGALRSAMPSLPKANREGLSLNFGCAGLNPIPLEKCDASQPLQNHMWYHGAINRLEAEKRLAQCQEGSYLVRVCEGNRKEYALSLKSAKGFMHMKIQLSSKLKKKSSSSQPTQIVDLPTPQWVLGYFSQPFQSIPHMIRYYSVNKLPIKGAEHMCLLNPVAETSDLL